MKSTLFFKNTHRFPKTRTNEATNMKSARAAVASCHIKKRGGGGEGGGSKKSVLGLVIPRWKILYSASFTQRAGFAGCHVLKQLGKGQRGAAWLTREILRGVSTLSCPVAPPKDSRPFHSSNSGHVSFNKNSVLQHTATHCNTMS